jgi:hypothetical protein
MKKEEVENYLHQKIEKGETVSPILPGEVSTASDDNQPKVDQQDDKSSQPDS